MLRIYSYVLLVEKSLKRRRSTGRPGDPVAGYPRDQIMGRSGHVGRRSSKQFF